MQFREFSRTSRNFLLFPLVLAGVVVGFMLAYGLMGAASFRHPWTWIFPIIGLAIFDGIIWFFYREKSTFGHIFHLTHKGLIKKCADRFHR